MTAKVSDPSVDEWLRLLELTTNYMSATEELVDGLQGKLGVKTREEAASESKRRVDAYSAARRALVEYARGWEAILDSP